MDKKTTQSNLISSIQNELQRDLPGEEFQDLMSPAENSESYRIVAENHKVACVMALIHQKEDGQHYLTYIKRTSMHPDDKHAGQIGFPGGKLEEEDATLLMCALREVEEEVGIPSSDIKVIGELTSLYIAPSNFLVHPYVGYLSYEPSYTPQESEVADVIEISLSSIFETDIKLKKKHTLATGQMVDVPGYNLGDSLLWGATAMITRELEEVVKRAK